MKVYLRRCQKLAWNVQIHPFLRGLSVLDSEEHNVDLNQIQTQSLKASIQLASHRLIVPHQMILSILRIKIKMTRYREKEK